MLAQGGLRFARAFQLTTPFHGIAFGDFHRLNGFLHLGLHLRRIGQHPRHQVIADGRRVVRGSLGLERVEGPGRELYGGV